MRADTHVYGTGQVRLETGVSHAAHFMSRSKKDVVAAAVREYIDGHRDEINVGIKAALGQLNGSHNAAVSLMTGFSADELDASGGLPE